MGKLPVEVAGFLALPLRLPSTHAPSASREATHYLYLKPHDPPVPDEETPRSLFLVNVPVSATAASLKHFLTTQLMGGRVEKVQFTDDLREKPSSVVSSKSGGGRKRKRITAEELEAGLDRFTLPHVFDSHIHPSGSSAVVVFVDRPSMELTLKAARRLAKSRTAIVWGGDGTEQKPVLPHLGLMRYEHHKHRQFPSSKELLRSVNGFMTAWSQLEEARSRETARKRQEPDEDGFVTVTRGARGSVRADEAKEIAERQKEKNKALEDFYRFQTRQKRKEEQSEMLRKFEEDKRRVEEMRHRRGKLTPG
ncbi:hypothetical protein HRR83_008588 [Exophiala dermatitidis]|uniref:Meiotic recombination protein DMC1 n=1 Tax=Exophiala dermatitidis TaxID=5970 RepID=A0AAN6IV27_EXODE|nr:hypothetical protein HRR75_007788 [Exophiala dermatitidis]KAJ4505589.1 hypothetical protein HRR73_008403 [Exophiala dermatitidis]KAJ4536575.1 hypothetical protein HRR76_004609 [Exophiala dermatitidis]KAJ4555819.1 hypothetical protein HRR77_001741 [Exophiala dermatitidis]KAJ4556056.1 hypothetical protein HRR78_001714 [Exophiala dermatitidis]